MKTKNPLHPGIRRNFVHWNRKGATVKHHLPVLLKPLLAGLALILLWRFVLHPLNIGFNEHSKEPILFIVLPLVGFIYVIFASVAVASVFDQYRTISKSVVKNDKETFLLYRDEQLPIIMHLLIAVPSLIIVAFVLMFEYHTDTWLAMSAIFAVTFVLTLIWVIATELDDFSKSIWFREKVPTEWYEADIEKYFNRR